MPDGFYASQCIIRIRIEYTYIEEKNALIPVFMQFVKNTEK